RPWLPPGMKRSHSGAKTDPRQLPSARESKRKSAHSRTSIAHSSWTALPPPATIPAVNAPVDRPRLIVYSSLFPSEAAPQAGVFIRERMFRVGERIPIVVVAPQAWSPFDRLIRLFRPGFRPMAPARET